MIPEPALRWIFTIAFAAAGLFFLYRCVRHGAAAQRVNDGLHLAMCAGMIAMAWPAAVDLARVPQVLLFGAATVWFVGLLVFDVRCHHGRLSLAYHAVMLAAMTWMVLVMPGMSMSGAMTMAPHVVAIAIALTVVFAGAGVFWLARAIRARGAAVGLAADAVMGLGMALMAGVLI